MNKPSKLFLTSGFCMVMIAPAIADIASDNSNPTCDATTIGASSGNTSLDAVWNLVNQTCESGKYFDMTSATCVTCTSNNYCPGGTYSVESQTNGLNSCPAGYGLSAQGSSAQTDCYRNCTTNDVAHSTAVSGGYYYGNNNQCSAESCALGWHIQSLQLPDEYTNSGTNTYASYTNSGFYATNSAAELQALYGLNQQNTWAASLNDYDFGTIYGQSACSTIPGDNNNDTWVNTPTVANITDETGQAGAKYCYCKITGHTPILGGTKQDISADWLFLDDRGTAYGYPSACAEHCATACAYYLSSSYNSNFRNALLSTPTNITASCQLTEKSCVAGEYFDATTIMCKTCDANHYCPGGVYTIESESYGKNNCPSGYGLSVAGTSSQNYCYRNCTTNDVAHSTGVSGGYYYGDNNQCGATSCAAGWHLNSFNLATEFANAEQTNSETSTHGYINADGNFNEDAWNGTAKGQSAYGITQPMEYAVSLDDYSFGMVRGQARCSKTPGDNNNGTYSNPTTFNSLTDETGETGARYCYCNITGYKPIDGQWQSLSSAWVFDSDNGASDYCASDCTRRCAFYVQNSSDTRGAVFGAVAPSLASCEPNVINIDWYNMDTIHEQNQCTYSESITLPETNPERTGYNFTGWTVRPASTPATTE